MKFTKKQLKVIGLLVSTGAGNKEIAKELHISEATVKQHITKITRAVEKASGAKHCNRTQVVLWFIKNDVDKG